MEAIYVHRMSGQGLYEASVICNQNPSRWLYEYHSGLVGTQPVRYRQHFVRSLPEHGQVNHPAHDSTREQLLEALMGIWLLEVEPEVSVQGAFWIDDEPGRHHLTQQLKVKMTILHVIESPDVVTYLSVLDELRKVVGLDDLLAMGRYGGANHKVQEPVTLTARQLAAEMEVAEGMTILCETKNSRIVMLLGHSFGNGVFDARAEICGNTTLVAGDVLFRDVRSINEKTDQRTICSVIESV